MTDSAPECTHESCFRKVCLWLPLESSGLSICSTYSLFLTSKSSGRSLPEARRLHKFQLLLHNQAGQMYCAVVQNNAITLASSTLNCGRQCHESLFLHCCVLCKPHYSQNSNINYLALINTTFTPFLWKPLVKASSHILHPPSCSLTGLAHKACWPSTLRSVNLRIRLGHLPMSSQKERKRCTNIWTRVDLKLQPPSHPHPLSKKFVLRKVWKWLWLWQFNNPHGVQSRRGVKEVTLQKAGAVWKVRRHSFILLPSIDPRSGKKKEKEIWSSENVWPRFR